MIELPYWLVPIDIVKKLKDINFNEKCFFYLQYQRGTQLVLKNPFSLSTETVRNYNLHFDDISLPTWDQVFKWFRRKNIHSHIEYTSDNDSFKIKIEGIHLHTTESFFKTYEEAQKALINKLIEIYENR